MKKNHFKRLTLLVIAVMFIQLAIPSNSVFSQNTDELMEETEAGQTLQKPEEMAPTIDEQNNDEQDEEASGEPNEEAKDEVENTQSEGEDTQPEDEDTQPEVMPKENNEDNGDPEEEGKEGSLSEVGLVGGFGIASEDGPKDLGNIFTNPRLTLNDVEIKEDDIIDIDENTKYQLEYQWHTKELNVKAGDTASIQLPDIFKQVNVQNQPVVAGNIQVGTYSIVNGKLTITFNENIEDGSISNGFVGLNLEFDLEKFEEKIEQRIEFNDQDETILDVIARPIGDISGIDKEGHPDREMNAREITWTIDVMNANDEPITNAVLKDVLPDGLGTPRDFVINELSIGINGDKRVGNTVEIESKIDGREFTIEFDEITPFNGYRIEFKTDIDYDTAIADDEGKYSFTNNATFQYGEKNLPATGTVHGLERSNPIEKEGEYNSETGQIDWTITINESGGVIDEAIVYDTLPDELELVEGSIAVTKFDSDWGSRKDVDIDEMDFPINLGSIAADEIYQITFSTSIDWSKVNDGKYQEYNEFTNETKLNDGDFPIGEDDATVGFERDTLLEKSGVSNVDYDNNTLTWTVEVNKAKHPLTNVVITDLIPAGLNISIDHIVITGVDVDKDEAITIEKIIDGDNEGKTKVTIDLGNIGTETITIEYTTTIEDFKIDEFDNEATLAGDGIGEETPEDNETIKPPANSFAKGFEGIDYNEKTMNWKLTVNPIREAITELTIVDTFPNKGMILLPDTLVVKVGGEKVTEGFTLTPNREADETGYHKGFTIEFDEPLLPLNALMEITYQTSYDPQREVEGKTLDPHVGGQGKDRVYVNHAQFTGETEHGNEFNTGRDAKTTVRKDSWNSGKKEGQLVREDADGNLVNGWTSGSERKIAWQLYTNYQQQNLGTGVVITDILAYEGTIDEGSVEVSVYTVDAKGNTTITGNVLSENNYTVSYNGKSFTLTFNNNFTVEERYVVEFTTTVPNISQPNYTNNATVTVGDTGYPYSGTVNYNKHDKFLAKGAVGVDGNQVFTGDEVEWQVTVNESLSIVQNAVITDTISEGLVYLEGSLSIATVSGRAFVEGEDKDYKLEVTDPEETVDGKTVLTITLNEDLTETLVLNYTTVVIATDGQVNNTIRLDGENFETDTITSEQLNAQQFSWVGGDFNPKRGAIQLEKMDAEEEVLIGNNEATFELWYELNGERVQYTQVDEEGAVLPFTTENGVLEIGNLPIRTYYLIEVESPKGYVRSEEEIEITVEPFGNNQNYHKVKFENTKERIDVTGTKEWVYGEAIRPESIELQLYQNDKKHGDPVKLNEENEWSHTWSGLDKTDIDGKEHKYTVDEVEELENYEKFLSEDGLEVTNTYVIPTDTSATATKTWENGPAVKPTIWFKLYRNIENGTPEAVPGVEIKELANGVTEVKWTELESTDINGNAYTFFVKEVDAQGDDFVPENYEKDEDGLEVTNTYIIPTDASATATKTWENGPAAKPTIWFKLYRNIENGTPEAVPDAEIKELVNGVTQVEWTGLESTDINGNVYTFSVKEVDEEGNESKPVNYDKVEEGLDVTNTYVIPKISVTGIKVWEGGSENKPAIELQLYRQIGEAEKETVGVPVTLDGTEDPQWTHTWTELDQTNIDGEEYTYTVDEVNVPGGYVNDAEGYVVTNTYVIPKTDITGTKTWINGPVDARPTIELQLYRQLEGEEKETVGEPVVLENGTTEYTWNDIEVTDFYGNEYIYTVEEVEVPENYTSEADGLTVTNTYVIPEISITGTKVWEGGMQDDRPEIQLQLFRNGEEFAEPITLDGTEDTPWIFTWADLDKTDIDGNEYVYTVDEVKIPENYVKTLSEDGLTVTNTYVSPKVEVTGTKVWEGAPLEKPDIEIQLFRNGEAYGEAVLLKDGTTSYTWTDLDETDFYGNAYVYTIDEVVVPKAYRKTISEDGLTITNAYDRDLDDDAPGGPGSGEGLPKTGPASNLGFYIIGMVLILLGIMGVIHKRRKSVTDRK